MSRLVYLLEFPFLPLPTLLPIHVLARKPTYVMSLWYQRKDFGPQVCEQSFPCWCELFIIHLLQVSHTAHNTPPSLVVVKELSPAHLRPLNRFCYQTEAVQTLKYPSQWTLNNLIRQLSAKSSLAFRSLCRPGICASDHVALQLAITTCFSSFERFRSPVKTVAWTKPPGSQVKL